MLTASFSFSYLFEGYVSKYSHILQRWVLELQHDESGENTIQPLTITVAGIVLML